MVDVTSEDIATEISQDFDGTPGETIVLRIYKKPNTTSDVELYDLSVETCLKPAFLLSTISTVTSVTGISISPEIGNAPPQFTIPFVASTVLSTTPSSITVPAPVCVFSQQAFIDNFGYEQINLIGYVEKDGQPGLTSNNERIYVNDTIEAGVTVLIGCSNCTCESNTNILCQVGSCENCSYADWSAWTDCSKPCDNGQQTRERLLLTVTNPNICTAPVKDTQDCNTLPCPTTVTTPVCSAWAEWSNCLAPTNCTEGTRTRVKTCSSGPEFESEPCISECTSTPACVAPYVLLNCSHCPSTCRDYRLPETCTEPDTCEPGCGCPEGFVQYNDNCIPAVDCPCYNDAGDVVAEGFTYLKDKCEQCQCTSNGTFHCYKIADCCDWSDWGPWGECSDTCETGVHSKYRQLNDGNPDSCGSYSQTESCTPIVVPGTCVDCIHDNKFYSVGEIISRQDDGCVLCYCDSTHNVFCTKDEIAVVDGNWSGWSAWSSCSSSCDGGNRQRTRLCNDPLPLCDGLACNGTNVEMEDCNADISCCTTSDWSDWSDCSSTCGPGEQAKIRSFVNTDDQNICPNINTTEIRSCQIQDCGCSYGEWTPWSECTVSCGIGIKRRTQNLAVISVNCPLVNTESEQCSLADCICDKNHTAWSNHTMCEKTCANRYNPIPIVECVEIAEGCICDDDYYLNQLGECVKEENCSVCYTPEPKQAGEIWTNANNTCEKCECVDGEVKCSRTCQIPVCSNNEELEYDPNDPCCPICRPVQTTCTLRTDFKVLESGDCITTEPIFIKYCSGGCGNSTSTPMLVLNGQASVNLGIIQDCKCCTGTVSKTETVDVVCGALKIAAKAQIAMMDSCSCNSCI
ncbi:Hypothetical predicted protein [Mytilus galloprovincialis]|uniref:SCO-spondin n=1 Tax=Mytilus galloprovincialis TaxID=29158 RepID=A0A8B6DPM0_MYTGA|nr:Hypothetical predicted protein [Mytilus galloprovincialis]